MHITPLDIRKQPFRRVFRGFDPDAVTSFLEVVASQYEECNRQNNDYATRIKNLELKLEGYLKIERTLNETLLTAQRICDESRISAQKEAELIVKDAMIRAGHHEIEVRKRVAALENDIASLKNMRDTFLARFRGLLTTQLNLLGVISGDLQEQISDKELVSSSGLSDEDTALTELPPGATA